MKCLESVPLLNAYLDGELPVDQAEVLDEHLRECTACREQLAAFRDISAKLGDFASEKAPAELHAKVLDAIAAVRETPVVAPAPRGTKRWWPAVVAAAAAVVVVAFFFASRGLGEGEALLQGAQDAVARTSSVHMVCKWYRYNDRSKIFTQREIWVAGNEARWDEAPETSDYIQNGQVRKLKKGRGRIPDNAGEVTRRHSLSAMLSNLILLEGPGVHVEKQPGVQWAGKTYTGLVVKDSDYSGKALRTVFLLDPATLLPVHGEQQKQIDGRWETEGTLTFQFNARVAPAVLKGEA